jgi:hypothetical protein
MFLCFECWKINCSCLLNQNLFFQVKILHLKGEFIKLYFETHFFKENLLFPLCFKGFPLLILLFILIVIFANVCFFLIAPIYLEDFFLFQLLNFYFFD